MALNAKFHVWDKMMTKMLGFLAAMLFFCGAAHAQTVLITGSNSGIGYEFARQYAAKGWTVIATHRRDTTPDNLVALAKQYPKVDPERMDVTKVDQVKALAAKMKGQPIDVIINNAGLYVQGDWANHDDPARHFPTLVFDDGFFDDIMDTNVRGPVLVTQTFLDNLRAGSQKKVINITSAVGELSPTPMSQIALRAVWYGISKAAQNKASVVMANVLKKDGIIVVPMHPGVVMVERSPGAAGRASNAQNDKIASADNPDAAESAPTATATMIDTIGRLTLADSGKLINYAGAGIPW